MTDLQKYARLDGRGQVVEIRSFPADRPPDADIPHKGIRWLPYVDTPRPPNDPAKVIGDPVNQELADRVERVWPVKDKAAEELAAEDQARRDGEASVLDRPAMAAVVDELTALHAEIAALKGEPAATREDVLAALKARIA